MSHGGKEFVRFLVQSGSRHLFGLPGSSMVAPVYELQNTDVEFIPCIHESVAVAAADGYSRVAGSAVVLLYMLPGLANGLTNIYNAWRDESSLIVVASQQASRYRSLSATVGEGDLVGMATPFTRFAHELAPGMDMGFWLDKALSVSTGQLPGPVFLSIPEDVFEGEVAKTSFKRARKPVPAVPEVDNLAEALADAERPLIVVGGQLRRFGGSKAIEDLSSRYDVAMAYETGFQDRLGVAPGHENSFGNLLFEPELESSPDFVLVLGARLMLEAHPQPSWFSNAQFIAHVNADPLKLEETRRADWATAVDPGAFAVALLAKLDEMQFASQKKATRRKWLNSLRRPKDVQADPFGLGLATYARAIAPLHDAMDRGWLVDEALTGGVLLQGILSSSNGERYIGTTGAALGWGPGAAAGVAIASGEPVTCVIGDGTLRFGALGLWTIRAQNLPVTIVVLDNGGYASTRFFERKYVERLGPKARPQHASYYGSDFRGTGSTVEGIIEGFNIPVEVVSEGNDAREAIERAWSSSEKGPNAVVIKMDFGE